MNHKYKFLRLKDGEIKSEYGHMTWEIGEWAKVPGKLAVCGQGLHCSARMFDAFNYVTGEIVARVEVAGKHEIQDDKEAWEELRLIDARYWRKEDSVALSIYAAELCLDNFERVMPGDERPRKAIEAAKAWLKNPTSANKTAAYSAANSADSAAYSAANSAYSAAYSAARSAARSAANSAARSAAYSAANSAAYSAANSAYSAAYSAADSAARSAARSAANSALVEQVNTWMENRFDLLPKYNAKEVTPEHITSLEPNQIIVVGTNTAGMHGAGLAALAARDFGLEAGVGEGLSGKTCYAYPTLNGDLEKRTDAAMKRSAQQFYATVKALPEKQFLLTKVGCGIAGYDESYMKELFAEDVDNLTKPEGW